MSSKAPPAPQVKNKNPAPIQITAEQILREATGRLEAARAAPKQRLIDADELDEYRYTKRKHFEDLIRVNRTKVGNWIKYASWEESQKEFERARMVYERGIEMDPRSQVIWMRYVEMEIRLKNVNHARNIFDRVVSILPRVDLFWYKYVYMEEMLENVIGARLVFERWMEWEPTEEAWLAYIKFEQRYKEIENVRKIYHRFVSCRPLPKNWLKWAKFEETSDNADFARTIYKSCLDTLGQELVDQNFYVSYAKFEIRQKEIEKARSIFKSALEKLPKSQSSNLYNEYVVFEKQHGVSDHIEVVVLSKRRKKYEADLELNAHNYDTWFAYIKLEEEIGDYARIRDLYERAISKVPPVSEKRFWRRYVYLWLFYAVWEESVAQDVDRAREVYVQSLKVIPHKTFTFAKLWIQYARFLIRQKDLAAARKTLGMSVGMCPKARLFKGYIELELSLREFDRIRTIYEKFLEWNPTNCTAWMKYAEFEKMIDDIDRARGIYEIAVQQNMLDMPEVLWKAYIDFESDNSEYSKARALYERLLDKTQHVKVWISFAGFENSALDRGDETRRLEAARKIFERGDMSLKSQQLKEERVLLLESWKKMEEEFGTSEQVQKVEEKMPRIVKKRRRVEEDGSWEEYYDYIFPDDEVDKPNFKLLEMAHQWKLKMQQD